MAGRYGYDDGTPFMVIEKADEDGHRIEIADMRTGRWVELPFSVFKEMADDWTDYLAAPGQWPRTASGRLRRGD